MFKKIIGMIFIMLFISSYTYGKDKLKVVTSIAPLAYFIENITHPSGRKSPYLRTDTEADEYTKQG